MSARAERFGDVLCYVVATIATGFFFGIGSALVYALWQWALTPVGCS